MAALMALVESNHLNMAAVERTEGDELIVPCVVHWKENHYAAIIAQKGDLYGGGLSDLSDEPLAER